MKWIAKRVSRRTMLKGVGAALSLPLLDIMTSSSGAATSVSQESFNRIAYIYFPNGVADGTWTPEKTGRDGKLLKLNRWMEPLEAHKEHLIISQKMWTPRGNGHGAGTATWLTGGEYDERRVDAGGISADQIVAREIGEKTLLPSLELSIKGEGYFTGNLPRNSISWHDSRTPLSREVEPRSVFDLMFRTSDVQGVDKSVVDLAMESAKQLQRQGSREDRRKIDEYLQSIRGVEKRLKFADSRTRQIMRGNELTDTLTRPQEGIPSDHGEYLRLMMDMMVLAFWADATRVCSLMMDHGQSNRYFDFIPQCKGTWHALSHYRDISGRTEDDDGKTSWTSVKSKRAMYSRVSQWHHAQFAYLLSRLREIEEANGRSLLDNSTICYGSSISDGNGHGEHDLPIVIAGGGGGKIRSGRLLKPRRAVSMSKLHLAMIRGMGVEQDRFGDAREHLDLS